MFRCSKTVSLLVVWMLLFIPHARGQTSDPSVELLVRLNDTAAPTLRQALTPSDDPSGEALRLQDPLFQRIDDTRPVFRSTERQTASPIARNAFLLTVSDSTALDSVRARWAARPDVQYVQPNITYTLNAASGAPLDLPTENVLSDSLDHLGVIRAPEVWDETDGTDVRIGILDTGLYLEHPDLASQLWVNPAEDANGNGRFDPEDLDGTDADGNGLVDDVIGYDFVDRPGLPFAGEYTERDPDPSADLEGGFSGHGTLVAGVAAGRPRENVINGVYGTAPGASIVPLRAFAGDGRGQTDDIAAAIVYAAEQGVDVINLSFGRDLPSPLL